MATKLVVVDGRVRCPRRGEVDVEECWFCLAVEDIRREGDDEVVVCSPGFARTFGPVAGDEAPGR